MQFFGTSASEHSPLMVDLQYRDYFFGAFFFYEDEWT